MTRALTFGATAMALLVASGTAARADVVVAYGPGSPPVVRTFTPRGTTVGVFDAYDRSFTGGVRVATGDVNGDGFPDVITGAGAAGVNGHVKAFSGATGTELRSFFAFDGFLGAVEVAAGDVNGDGTADIVAGTGEGGVNGHVKVFDGRTGAEVRSFFAFPGFVGGVTVAAGDVSGDGRADIIVGAGPGAPGGHVKVFDGVTGDLARSFFAFDGFQGGVRVAAGDLDGDGLQDLVVGTGSAGGHVKVFDADITERASFFAFDGFSGGVSIAVGDVDGDGRSDLVSADLGSALGHVKVFSGSTARRGPGDPLFFTLTHSFFAAPEFEGGVYVAAIPPPAVGGLAALALALAARRRR